EQREHRRRSGRADVLLVLHEIARQHGRHDDERGRAVELRRLAGATRLLQACERLRSERAETPRLRHVVGGREARDREQLEERLLWDRLRAERLVRAASRRQLGERHASRALVWSATPAARSSCEKGQPSSAFANAACSASSSSPSTETTASTCDATIWWPFPSTSSMTMRHETSRWPGGVPACVNSLASDIVMQPPCAAASSSSGLVFPSACPIRVGSEYSRSENAPVP